MFSRDFRYLWLGQSIANMGDIFYIVAIMAFLHAAKDSAIHMALVPFFITLARFVSGIISPVMIDKYSLKMLLVFSQIGKTLILLTLTCFLDFFIFSSAIVGLYICVFIIAFFDGWASPARNSMIPNIVEKEVLIKANSFMAVIDQSIQLSAWPIGGILIVYFNEKNVMWITIVMFLLSTIFMMCLKNQSIDTKPNLHFKSKFISIREGWVETLRKKTLKTILLLDIFETVANGVWLAAILYIYVSDILKKGEQWWGYINSSFFFGMVLGGIACFKLSSSIQKKYSAIIMGSMALMSVTTLLFGSTANPYLALLLSLVFGSVSQMKTVAQQAIIQQSLEGRMLPKFYAVYDTTLMAAFGLTALLFGILTDYLGVRFIYIIGASVLGVGFLYSFIHRKQLNIEKL